MFKNPNRKESIKKLSKSQNRKEINYENDQKSKLDINQLRKYPNMQMEKNQLYIYIYIYIYIPQTGPA